MIIKFIEDWYKTHTQMANFALIKQIDKDINLKESLKNSVCIKTNNTGQMLYHLINNIDKQPLCPVCNKLLEFKSLSSGYLTYCSKGCKTKHAHKQGKFKESRKQGALTFKKKYGKNAAIHNDFIKKREETCIKKYGVRHHMKDPKVVHAYMQSCIEKYNETNPMKCNVIKDKVNKTNLKIYGTKRPLQNTEVFERMFKNYKKTIKDKYDVDCVFQIPEVFTKIQDNSFRRFSYRHLHYQASYEKDFIKYCEKLGFIDEVSDGPFVWYLYNGKRRRYFSDFYIKKYNLIIEVKSMYWYNSFKEQNKAKREECLRQGFNFIFIIDKDYSEFNKYLEQQGLFKQCTLRSTLQLHLQV